MLSQRQTSFEDTNLHKEQFSLIEIMHLLPECKFPAFQLYEQRVSIANAVEVQQVAEDLLVIPKGEDRWIDCLQGELYVGN